MEHRNSIFKIMFVALLTTATAFSMDEQPSADSQSCATASSSSSSNELKWVTLQGKDYSLKIPLEVAKVSKVFEKEIEKKLETYNFKQGEFLVKVPPQIQISQETLLKLIPLMRLVAELQKEEAGEDRIISEIYCITFKKIEDYLDVILVASDLGCSYIFKALILALKGIAPVPFRIQPYPYLQALAEIRAQNSSAKSKSSNDAVMDNRSAPIVADVIVEGMAKLTIEDLNRSIVAANGQKLATQIQVILKNGEVISLKEEDAKKASTFFKDKLLNQKVKNLTSKFTSFDDGAVRFVCSAISSFDIEIGKMKPKKILDMLRANRAKVDDAMAFANHLGCQKISEILVTVRDIFSQLRWGIEEGVMEISISDGNNLLAFSPEKRLLLFKTCDKKVQLEKESASKNSWECILSEKHNAFSSATSSATFSPNGELLVIGTEDGTVKEWDFEERIETPEDSHDGAVNSVVFGHNTKGNLLWATASDDGTAKLWKFGRAMRILIGHNGPVKSIAFSSDDVLVATGSADKTAKLWNIEEWQKALDLGGAVNPFLATGKVKVDCAFTLFGHNDSVNSVAFSPVGRILATGSSDRTVKLWKVGNELVQLIQTLSGHSDSVTSVKFSPDGKLLATESVDKKVKIWNMETFQCVRTLDGVTLVNFCSDGKLYLVMWPKEGIECRMTFGYIIPSSNKYEAMTPFDFDLVEELNVEQINLIINLHRSLVKNEKIKLNSESKKKFESESLPQEIKDYYKDVVE